MQLLPEENKASQQASEPSTDECAQCVLDMAPPVVRTIRNLMRNHRLAGLSVPQFRAMALLSFSPRASLSCVADYVGSSLSTASRMIDGLVGKKLVARQECCEDRRQVSLALTARGQNAFRQSRQATQRQLSRRLEHLSGAQRTNLVEAMKWLGDIFGSDADRTRPAFPNCADRPAVSRVKKVRAGGPRRSDPGLAGG